MHRRTEASMTDFVFNKDQIESLCEKISKLQSELTPEEVNLLLAIFAVAADQAKPRGNRGLEGTLPQSIADVQPVSPTADDQDKIEHLKQQLLNSYIPGESFKSVAPDGDTGRIGGRLIVSPGSSAASGTPGSPGGTPASGPPAGGAVPGAGPGDG
jgi:hypothetical protein